MAGTKEKAELLQARISTEDKALLATLAKLYGVSMSEMIRIMTIHFTEKRPVVEVRFAPKGEEQSG